MGLGRFYAHGLAKRGLNVVIVARSKDLLEGVAKEIQDQYKVQTRVRYQNLRSSLSLLKASPDDHC